MWKVTVQAVQTFSIEHWPTKNNQTIGILGGQSWGTFFLCVVSAIEITDDDDDDARLSWSCNCGHGAYASHGVPVYLPAYAAVPNYTALWLRHHFLLRAVTKSIAGTHCTIPRRDGQAEWACVAWKIRRWYPVPVQTRIEVAWLCLCHQYLYHGKQMIRAKYDSRTCAKHP